MTTCSVPSLCSVINVDGVDDGAVMRLDESGHGASTSGTNLMAAGTAAEDVARDDGDSWIQSFGEIIDLGNKLAKTTNWLMQ